MESRNPTLKKDVFQSQSHVESNATMTLDGTINKSFLLLFLMLGAGGFVWNKYFANPASANVLPYILVGGIGGLITALVTIFKQNLSKYTAPLYAILEGLFLGGISAIFESSYHGIVIQAILLTIGIFLGMLLLYKSEIIKVTKKFKIGVVAATGGVAFFYFLSFILGFFGIQMPLIHGSGLMGIGFSLVVVVIAALNLILDFDFISKATRARAPKYMEWYSSFSLMVTLVWLYLEILRLLSKLRE